MLNLILGVCLLCFILMVPYGLINGEWDTFIAGLGGLSIILLINWLRAKWRAARWLAKIKKDALQNDGMKCTTTLVKEPTAYPVIQNIDTTEELLHEIPSDSVIKNSLICDCSSQHYGYIVRGDKYNCAVLDGGYKKKYREITTLTFDHQGQHFAYLAKTFRKNESRLRWFSHDKVRLVIDEREVPENFPQMDGRGIYFNADSSKTTFIRYRNILIFNRVKSEFEYVSPTHNEIYEDTFAFSPSGDRWACGCRTETEGIGHHYLIIVDGIESEPFSYIGTPIFSHDDTHVAYAASKQVSITVFVNGESCRNWWGWSEISYVTFAPKGESIAFTARRGARAARVFHTTLEGGVLAEYKALDVKGLRFSNCGKNMAFAAIGVEGTFIVVNGNEKKSYLFVEPRSMTFSPDGERLAYKALTGIGKEIVVVDDRESVTYNAVLPPLVALSDDLINRGGQSFSNAIAFSSDSKHFVFVAERNGKEFVVIDNNERTQYDRIIGWPVFNNPNQLHYLALLGNRIYRVEEQFT